VVTAARRNAMKHYYSDVLLELCEERPLNDITASEFIARAGTARQTFYNYFDDIYDLVSYTASLPLLSGSRPLCDPENVRPVYEAALAHPAFYRQLADQKGDLSFRAALCAWQDETLAAFFIPEGLPADERERRNLRLHIYSVSSTELFIEWVRRGMALPVDDVLDMLYDIFPQFMKEACVTTPPANTLPTYPK
jgi:AcrR family transcriptional regulator